jgi:hypothetical protein
MKVYVFTSKTKKLAGGFTQDKSGSNLPSGFGEWIYKEELDLTPSSPLMGAKPKDIIDDILEKGFSIQKAGIITKEIS